MLKDELFDLFKNMDSLVLIPFYFYYIIHMTNILHFPTRTKEDSYD
jgi:hypothetical protein